MSRSAMRDLCREHSGMSSRKSGLSWLCACCALTLLLLLFFLTFHNKPNQVSRDNDNVSPSWNQASVDPAVSLPKHLQSSSLDPMRPHAHQPSHAQPLSDLHLQQARQHAPTTLYQSTHVSPSLKKASISNDHVSSSHEKVNSMAVAQQMQHLDTIVMRGEVITATLETAIHTDLPGLVRAVINRPVYAFSGHRVLIPAGSRLLGDYVSKITQGITRVFVVWHRIVLPSGVVVNINSASSDAIGQAGLQADVVNTHFMTRFSESALLSVLGGASATAGVSSTDRDNSLSNYRSTLSQNLQQQAATSMNETSATQPTLMVYQGASIVVLVAQDISFHGVMNDQSLL